MKLALRYIPTEVWVDVFCYPWISRKKLGKIVHMFRNHKFAEILQYCLHERGKRMLSPICLDQTMAGIPQTPLPENIKFFKNIAIEHFDSRALDFLRLIGAIFTTNDVNLFFPPTESEDQRTALRTILGHLAPLFHGIHSIWFRASAIPLVEQYFGPKLAQVKMISLHFGFGPFDSAAIQTGINFAMNWLTSEERGSDEPKFLKIFIHSSNSQQFVKAVQQQFLLAKSARTFAVELILCCNVHCCAVPAQTAGFHLENNLGEQLDGKFDEAGDFLIYRHQTDFTRTQLEEWVKQIVEKRDTSSGIGLFGELTIGQIDTSTSEVNNAGGEEEDDQPSISKSGVNVGEEEAGPSTSKRPKLA